MKKTLVSIMTTLVISSINTPYVTFADGNSLTQSTSSSATVTPYQFKDGTIYYSLVDVIGKIGQGANFDQQTKEFTAQFNGVTIKIPLMPTTEIKINDQPVELKTPVFVVKPKDQAVIYAPKEMFEDAKISLNDGPLVDITKPPQNAGSPSTDSTQLTAQQTPAPSDNNNVSGTADNPLILVNGTQVQTDVPPIIQDGRTLVPLRAIFEALHGKVEWDGNTGKIDGKLGDREVILYLNSPMASVNGQAQTLDVPASSFQGRTMVPLRFIGESLGAKVEWDQQNYRILITK